MELVKDYIIDRVASISYPQGGCELQLTSDERSNDTTGQLTFDPVALQQFNITPSLDLASQSLRCTLTSRELPRHYSDLPVDTEGIRRRFFCFKPADLKKDDVIISKISRVQTKNHPFFHGFWTEEEEALPHGINFDMIVHTLGEYEMLTFPDYQLTVQLSEGEYNKCMQLPWGTVFRVRFQLLDNPPRALAQ